MGEVLKFETPDWGLKETQKRFCVLARLTQF